MAGEIATAFVRIRPNLTGFKEQATAGVREGLVGVQEDVKAASRSSVAGADEIALANKKVADSFAGIGEAATANADAIVAANRRAAESFAAIGTRAKTTKEETGSLREGFLSLSKVIGVAFGADIAFQGIKNAVNAAASLQKQVELVKAEFGGAGEALLAFGEKGAGALGISASAADTAAARMGLLFKNIGVGQKTAASATLDMLKLAGSLSAIRGIDPGVVLQSLPTALAGNTRSLKSLGIVVDQTQLKVIAFKLGLTQSITQALTPAQKALAIVAVATRNLGQDQALAQAHAGDLANVTRRLSAEWSNAKDTVGTALMPAITQLATSLGNWLTKLNESGRLQRDVNEVMKKGGEIFAAVKSAINQVLPVLKGLIQDVGGVKDAVKLMVAAWATWKIASLVGSIGTLAAKLGPQGALVVGLAAVAAGAQVAANKIAALQNAAAKAELRPVSTSVLGGALVPKLAGMIDKLKAQGKSAAQIREQLFQYLGAGNNPATQSHDLQASDLVAAAYVLSSGRAGVLKKQLDVLRRQAGDSATAIGKEIRTKIGEAASPAGSPPPAATAGVDAAVSLANAQLDTLKTKLHDLIAQNAIDIANTVTQAKANLLSIASTLSNQVGQIIDQPFTVASMRIQAAQDKLSLLYDAKNAKLQAQTQRLARTQAQLGLLSDQRNVQLMKNEVLLPGGKALSSNPAAALKQLEALSKSANQINRPAIDAFILQYRGALLQVSQDKLGLKQSNLDARRQVSETRLGLKQDALAVAQDTANRMKMIAQRSIADFASSLASGAITLKQFNRKLAKLLSDDHISYKRAGALLGSAFSTGFQDQLTGIERQAAAIAAGPHIAGTGQAPKIVRPELTFQRDQLKVTRLQQEIQSRQLSTQKKVAANTLKAAQTLAQLQAATLGTTSKSLARNPGTNALSAAALTGTTG